MINMQAGEVLIVEQCIYEDQVPQAPPTYQFISKHASNAGSGAMPKAIDGSLRCVNSRNARDMSEHFEEI